MKYVLLKNWNERGVKFNGKYGFLIYYKEQYTDKYFTIDLLIENEIIVELKSVERISALFEHQLMTYLKLTNKNLGLLVNFNVPRLIDGVKRMING